jgi:hypothetical protein
LLPEQVAVSAKSQNLAAILRRDGGTIHESQQFDWEDKKHGVEQWRLSQSRFEAM